MQLPRKWDWDMILENGEFKSSDMVLETGALFGTFSLQLADKVELIIVTDSYDWSDRRFVTADGGNMVLEWEDALSNIPEISIAKVDMQQLPYEDGSFDKVVCISAIEHVPDDRKAITEMMRVLKPGGLLLMTTEYNPDNAKLVVDPDGSFYRVYDDKGLAELTKGYKVVKQKAYWNTPKDFTTIFLSIKK